MAAFEVSCRRMELILNVHHLWLIIHEVSSVFKTIPHRLSRKKRDSHASSSSLSSDDSHFTVVTFEPGSLYDFQVAVLLRLCFTYLAPQVKRTINRCSVLFLWLILVD